MSRGRFITIEGVEGVGKSTNLEHIRGRLDNAGIPLLLTREPGGTAIGERLREILLDRTLGEMTPMTELLMVFAARAQHVDSVIKPALAAGTWVICDRFTDSSFAYQGAGREIGTAVVDQVAALTLGRFAPDHILVLDVPVALGLKRASQTGAADRFELENERFFDRVRQAFLARAATDSRYRVVDAAQSLAAVQAEIDRWLDEDVLTGAIDV